MRNLYIKSKLFWERALDFMLSGYEISYKDLLKKWGNPSINLRRTSSLCIEMYNTINNLNPEVMKNLFKVLKINRAQREQYKLNLEMPKSNQVFFGTKSLRIEEPRVWNTLPFYIKSKEHLQAFKFVTNF